jgi:hypothetical protein
MGKKKFTRPHLNGERNGTVVHNCHPVMEGGMKYKGNGPGEHGEEKQDLLSKITGAKRNGGVT